MHVIIYSLPTVRGTESLKHRAFERVKSQPLFPSLPPPLPKDDHHYYHFNIFLLIFLTDIQTQKYMHVYVPGATTGDPTHDKVHVEEDC